MKSVMKHQFSDVPKARIERSSFNRSHGLKTTFDAGWLIPIYVDEALPGDTFNLRMTAFARLATPLKPVMDNMYMDTFFFAVPCRLVWEHWKNFMGEKRTITDATVFTVPQMTGPAGAGILTHSLSDYLGLPTGKASITFNSLWHRAYNLIWNEWFRDQNLQNPVVVDTDDGTDTYTDYVLLRRGKRHDYFTSALPWPQKGPDVLLPLGTSAPVLGIGKRNQNAWANPGVTAYESDGTTDTYAAANIIDGTDVDRQFYVREHPTSSGYPGIYADLSNATASTINALRQSFQLQKMLERDARSGTRYVEVIKAHFGVTSPDFRMQRPEFLGGGSSPVNLHPVAQTSNTAAGVTPQGNLSAFGTTSASGHGFTKSFTEHCLLIGLVNVRADLTYQQGLPRMFSRRTRYDYYWPALAHLGEQTILNQEIYCDGSGNDGLTFGYQERYAEYRYKPSQVTGLMRSNVTGGFTTLDYWHLSQNLGALPTLAADFIVDDPPVDRVIAVSSEPHFLFDAYFDLKCARPMPVFSVPGLIDHF